MASGAEAMSSALAFTLLGVSILVALGIAVFAVFCAAKTAQAKQWGRFWALIGVILIWFAATMASGVVWVVMFITHAHGPEEAARNIWFVTGGFFVSGVLAGMVIRALRPAQSDQTKKNEPDSANR